ncbi:MAG TPA: ABC transporter permease [Gemmatimonadales bacterium]|nr:ABC transporter permease [Gemmatimonadales bacterium]
MSWSRRLRNLFRPEGLSHDIDREMAFHLSEKADELEARGMSRPDAEREARKRFGHRGTMRENTREVDVLGWLESLVADARYAFRALRANPGFTTVAVLSLGLGIGANTAIFSLVNAVILRALPIERSEELVRVVNTGGNGDFTNPIWEGLRDTPGMESYFAYGSTGFNLATGGEVRNASGAWVSGSMFPALRVRPVAGRLLEPSDDRRGCSGVAVVSEGFAAREFGGAANAVGQKVTLQGKPFELIGVVEPGFFGMEVGEQTAIYAPICSIQLVASEPNVLDRRSRWFLSVYGRRHPENGLEAEQALLKRVSPPIFAATIPPNWSPADQKEYETMLLTVQDAAGGFSGLRSTYKDALFVLLVVVATVLVIGCANVANLLLARAAARQHELAVRLAIGAGRWRLVRQMLTESLMLAFAGGIAGLLFARWASALLVRFFSTRRDAVFLDLTLDGRVLLFSIAAAFLTGLLFGLIPAWRASRVDPQSAMKAQGRGVTRGSRFALGRALVAGQVALSLVLIVAAGLLMGSFRKLVTMDPGFRREGVLLVSMNLANTGWPEPQRRATHRQILDRLRDMPGVKQAGASYTTPLSNSSWNDRIAVPGYAPSSGRDSTVMFNAVSEGWFATMGTDLVAGRDFGPADGTGAQVVVVNETLAKKFFPGESPLGRIVTVVTSDKPGPPMEVIGVVRDAKYQALREENQPTAYVPIDQGEWWGTWIEYQLRSDATPAALIPLVKSIAADMSPAITLEFNTFEEQVSASLRRPRLLATLSGFFAALALTLAVIGLYGTVAYGVARRRSEIGVRLALGAARGRVLRMVLADAGRLALVGIVAGVATALGTTRLLTSFLYGLTATDIRTLALSAVLLAGAAIAASLLPAWRAASLDPTETLREE